MVWNHTATSYFMSHEKNEKIGNADALGGGGGATFVQKQKTLNPCPLRKTYLISQPFPFLASVIVYGHPMRSKSAFLSRSNQIYTRIPEVKLHNGWITLSKFTQLFVFLQYV